MQYGLRQFWRSPFFTQCVFFQDTLFFFKSMLKYNNMNGKKVFIVLLIVLISLSGLFAQNPDEVSRMIETEEATVGQVGYFLAVYLELVPDVANGRASLDALEAAGYGSYKNADAPIMLKELAGLCMKVWKMKGGLMYSIFGSNHYAFREFQSKGYFSFADDPMAHISGYRALNVIYNCLENEVAPEPVVEPATEAAPAAEETAVAENAPESETASVDGAEPVAEVVSEAETVTEPSSETTGE